VTRFWPVGEAAQRDYETLRESVLAGVPLCSPAAARFARAGLWGLIRRPMAEPEFLGILIGALRPAWSPHADPRFDALAEGYQFVLTAGEPTGRCRPMQEVGS
jgi:hypothetical protein